MTATTSKGDYCSFVAPTGGHRLPFPIPSAVTAHPLFSWLHEVGTATLRTGNGILAAQAVKRCGHRQPAIQPFSCPTTGSQQVRESAAMHTPGGGSTNAPGLLAITLERVLI